MKVKQEKQIEDCSQKELKLLGLRVLHQCTNETIADMLGDYIKKLSIDQIYGLGRMLRDRILLEKKKDGEGTKVPAN